MLRRLLQSGPLQRLQGGSTSLASLTSLAAESAQPSTSRAAGWASAPQGPFTQLTSLLRFKTDVRAAGLKAYKPVTPGLRGRVIESRQDLWKGRPLRQLTFGLRKTAGRNNGGSITSWHRGGGHKRLYRMIDFKRRATQGPGLVERIEYDPNRSARIALVKHETEAAAAPQYSYILAPRGVLAGDTVASGPDAAIKAGSTLPLANIPVGQQIHNIELYPGRGGQLARAAGTSATLAGKGADGYASIKLPSGEQRLVLLTCTATIGALSNPQHKNIKLGKAGANRWRGRRPVVRGIAMNPVDHPHGGGRGKSKGRVSQSPWGKPAKGGRTRHNPRTDRFIVVSRHEAKRASA